MSSERAKEMLEVLKADFYAIWDENQPGNLGYVNLDNYKKRFDVTDTDIETYCASLKRIVPLLPCCMICGAPWCGLDGKTRPTNNGHHIEYVDSFTAYCPSKTHHNLWYYQNAEGRCSFDMEIDDGGVQYEVRRNCNCMAEQCTGKNVVYKWTNEGSGEIVAFFKQPRLPTQMTREELFALIETKV